MIRGVLIDISGVITDGPGGVPGAALAVARLRAACLPIRFLTNTTRRPKSRIVADLRALDVIVTADDVITPVAAALNWLSENGHVPHLLVHPDLAEEFAGCKTDGPVAVVLGDAAQGFSYANLNATFRALHKGAPFLALAANRVFRDGDGQLSLDAGPFVRALEYASDTTAIVLGKPAPDFFRAGISSLGCRASETAMIGDDAENDIAGALSAGLGLGILVRSGKYRLGDEDRVTPRPSAVVDDLTAAVEMILKYV